ncbi:carbohydrate ABC transporter permease [Gracilibacillus oryzae]|nr:sugar ABC transporter permease [Gracilibacillus oryzae]
MRITPVGLQFRYVGMNNYLDVWLKDMFFLQELLSFSMTTLLRVPVIVVFALIIAMLLNQNVKLKGTFRTIFFLPVIVASGPVINQLVDQGATAIPMVNQDVIISLLSQVFPMFITDVIAGLFSQIIIILWYSGVQILIFLAVLQKIDPSLYEAAKIDGGSSWECFWKITLPTIKPIVLINMVYTLVSLANSGQNPIIDLIYANMFNATRGYGFASAMAWMYAIIIGIMLIIIFLAFRERKTKRAF